MTPPKARPTLASSLLPDEHLESFSPSLAVALGLNEAILLHKIHSWVRYNERRQQTYANGHYWTFMTLPQWATSLPWWSGKTLQRIIGGLRDRGILITEALGADKRDRTLWYRIDYQALDQVLLLPVEYAAHDGSDKATTPIWTNRPDAVDPTCPDASSTKCPDVYKEQLLHTTTTSTTNLSVAPAPSSPEKIANAKDGLTSVLSVSAKTEVTTKDVVRQVRRTSSAGSQAAVSKAPRSSPPVAPAPPSLPAKPAKVPKAKKPRERDPFMDAVALACYGDTNLPKGAWSQIGKVKAELVEVGMVPEDVAALIAWMRLDKYWQSRPIAPISLTTQVSIWRMAKRNPSATDPKAAALDRLRSKYGSQP